MLPISAWNGLGLERNAAQIKPFSAFAWLYFVGKINAFFSSAAFEIGFDHTITELGTRKQPHEHWGRKVMVIMLKVTFRVVSTLVVYYSDDNLSLLLENRSMLREDKLSALGQDHPNLSIGQWSLQPICIDYKCSLLPMALILFISLILITLTLYNLARPLSGMEFSLCDWINFQTQRWSTVSENALFRRTFEQ